MPNNFFAMLESGEIRRINLTQDLTASIKDVFINAGNALSGEDLEEVEFDGNYAIGEEEVLYVSLALPDTVKDAATNAIGIPVLNLKEERVKALFWYESGIYYFQNFDKRKLLSNKNIIIYSNQTYSVLKDDAFIVDNIVHAIHKNEKLYFLSYANANKIFSLTAYYTEATNEEIEVFSTHENISISDKDWFMENSNTVVRKQITLIQKSNVLDGADTTKIQKKALKFKLAVELDGAGKIIFPSNKKHCKDLLIFLNEQFYIGLISGKHFRTNSKRSV